MTQGQTADTTPVQDRSAVAWSYASGPSETPLLGMTIGDALDQTAARYPTNEALIVRQQDVRYTYAELKREVDRCARALMALGIEKGQRVGIWAPNRAEWIITQLGTAKIGAILVNVNPAYRLNELGRRRTSRGAEDRGGTGMMFTPSECSLRSASNGGPA